MELFFQIMNALGMVVPVLLAVGAGWKYLPVVKKTINEGVIPILNAILTFFMLFGGGVTPANAGILDSVGTFLGIPGQFLASLLISVLTSKFVHDPVVKPLTPPSPYRLSKGT